MSILIKGMEMPRDDEMLCINIYPDGKVCITLDLKSERIATAIHVPPHRDLIDRAALRESFRESIEACHKWADEMRKAENEEMVIRAEQSLGTFVECSLRAKNAPTVIPADEPTIGEIVERTLKAKRLMTDNEEGK